MSGLQVSFRKSATNRRSLLRKMTYEDKVSHASSTPCIVSKLTRRYGVATVSRIDEIIGLFCRISSLL